MYWKSWKWGTNKITNRVSRGRSLSQDLNDENEYVSWNLNEGFGGACLEVFFSYLQDIRAHVDEPFNV